MKLKKCPICYSYTKRCETLILPCECFVCFSCMTEWTITKIKELRCDINGQIPCHEIECEFETDIQDIHEKLTHHYQEKINEALFETYLFQTKDIRKCPNSKCSYAGIIKMSGCSNPLECPMCQTQWKEYQHKFFYEKLNNILNQKDFSISNPYSFLRKTLFAKKCPRCEASVEKSNNSEDSKCLECQLEFCWDCGIQVPEHNLNSHLYKAFLVLSFGLIIALCAGYLLYFLPPVKFIIDWTFIPVYTFIWGCLKEMMAWISMRIREIILFNLSYYFTCIGMMRNQLLLKRIGWFVLSVMNWVVAFYFEFGYSMIKFGLLEGSIILGLEASSWALKKRW